MSTMCTTASGESTSSSGVITLGIAGGSGGGKVRDKNKQRKE
jgi:hypothetical protein